MGIERQSDSIPRVWVAIPSLPPPFGLIKKVLFSFLLALSLPRGRALLDFDDTKRWQK